MPSNLPLQIMGSLFLLIFYCNILSFIACLSASSAIAATHSIFSDADSLLSLKDHIILYPNHILMKNWSAGSPVCDWIGITCGKRHKRVTVLDISNMGLTATISPQLGNLSFLVSLDLSGNNFNGGIPKELSNLSRLKLVNFSLNSFTGEIPSWIGSLNQLQYLYLYNNSFNGSIPSSISNLTSLKLLDLNTNQLSGSIPFQLFNISTLTSLSLAINTLSGSLPDSLCLHLPKLKELILWSNLLDGPLPSKLSYCPQLTYLNFALNNFSGQIPEEFWNMKMLVTAVLNRNSLIKGKILKEISNLTSLQELDLDECSLTGVIPKEIGNLTFLTLLSLNTNNLEGTIPEEFGNNLNMRIIDLGSNGLSGSVPIGFFNRSTLSGIDISENYLSGSLHLTTGFGLPNLDFLNLDSNRFGGVIPPFISNSSRLRILDLARNNFIGVIPHYLGNLRFLEFLGLNYNMLTSGSSSLELEFLKQLSNCKYLKDLEFAKNPLNGILPESIGNMSSSLQTLEGSSCGISGQIPANIGNLSNLLIMSLSYNQLTGSLPTSISKLGDIQEVSLWDNKLSGTLPCYLFSLKRLNKLFLSNNFFSGTIPECIGNSIFLRYLSLDGNKFSSSIPMNLWNLKDLLQLDLSSNFLNGSLPNQLGNLKVVNYLNLSVNNISGYIPNTIGDFQNLVYLDFSFNLLEGTIPDSVGKILSLEYINFSENNLSGSIPMTLEKLLGLKFLNVSYNSLSGLIPLGGPFKNFTMASFIFNKALCGDKRFNIPPCLIKSQKKTWFTGSKHITILSFSLVAFIVAITLMSIYFILCYNKKVNKIVESLVLLGKNQISFYELQHATDNYNERYFLGRGSFGSVYKGTLRDGRVIAIKVFNLQAEGALQSFKVECEILRSLRHRNLTQVISCCSNLDFKAIVLEFMPNGSLENWLHFGNKFLNFSERMNIMIDVAYALQYLHLGYQIPVVHADLKPSNVLLDDDMVAHVSDFGITKMLQENSITYTDTLATFGYIAPEYGSEGLLSTKCDVYSFGIMLMEVFTRKSPTDEMFNEGMTLHGLVSNSIQSELADIVDEGLLNTAEKGGFKKMMDSIAVIMNLALDCTIDLPQGRIGIGEVLDSLNKIKQKFLVLDG